MADAVLSDADAKENGTSLNHKKMGIHATHVIQMGIHAITLLSHVQAEMS